MLKLCFFVPESHLEKVKGAVFAAGAGKIGNYDSCCWQVLGQGQFRALAGSDPYIGQQGVVETVAEWRVETVLEDGVMQEVVKALRESHPYEEPAFDLIRLEMI